MRQALMALSDHIADPALRCVLLLLLLLLLLSLLCVQEFLQC
jgi:hypothetical protein